jgi:hypothetical protein
MSHSRKKKNNRVNTSPVQPTISDDLKKKLNELEELYQETYVCFHKTREKDLISKIGSETKNNMTANLLLEAVTKITAPIHDMVINQKIYTNEVLLLYCKIKALSGHYMYEYENSSFGVALYVDVIDCINVHDKYLKYEDDVFFQDQIGLVFDIFSRQCPDETKLDKDKAKQCAELMSKKKLAYSIFKKRCGATIVSLIISHNELEKSYINGYAFGVPSEILNPTYKNNRDSFFSLAGKVKASFEKMKSENTFSTLYQIYYLELNYSMMNISELTHPKPLWIVQHINPVETVSIQRKVGFKEIKDHFNFWLRLKEDYINPTLSLIENINTDEINASIQLQLHYMPQIRSWLNVMLMMIDYLRDTVESWMSNLESLKTVPEYLQKEFYEYIFKLEAEKEMLKSSAAIIMNSFNKLECKRYKTLNENHKRLLGNTDTLETKVRELKSRMEELQKEKLQAANEAAAKLIGEETMMKEEKAKKRHLRYLKSLNQFFAEEKQCEPEACEDEDEKVLNTVTPISLELQDLTDIDVAAMKLSAVLKGKSQAMLNFITSRLALPVQLASSNHRDIFLKIRNMLVEYYELIALFEKHKNLSQNAVILREEQLTEGIGFSQDELNERCKVIYQNIQSLLKLIDEIIAQQKKSKDAFIFELGKKTAGPYASHDQIMNMGQKKLGKIREEKRAKGQEFSEQTKQNKKIF